MSHSNEMYRKLILLMIHSKRHMHAAIEEWELTPVQGMLLISFASGESKSMQKLADLMNCDASNITGLIDRMDSQGLIERTVDPKDRRVKMIQLSDKGCKCRAAILDSLRTAEAADLNKLTAEEVAAFEKIIDKLLG